MRLTNTATPSPVRPLAGDTGPRTLLAKLPPKEMPVGYTLPQHLRWNLKEEGTDDSPKPGSGPAPCQPSPFRSLISKNKIPPCQNGIGNRIRSFLKPPSCAGRWAPLASLFLLGTQPPPPASPAS